MRPYTIIVRPCTIIVRVYVTAIVMVVKGSRAREAIPVHLAGVQLGPVDQAHHHHG